MKKVVIGIVIAIILVIVVAIGVIVYNDFRQEDILREEMLAFENLTRAETIDFDQIDQKLREIKTTGDYGVLEKAMKEYLADSFNASIEVANVLNDEKITNALTSENYIEDGPDFVETKQYLADATEKLEQYKNEGLQLLSNEGAMSYIEGKNLDQYYIDLYKEMALSENADLDAEKQEIEASIDETLNILNIETQVINFLSENQENWEIQDENIVFSSEELNNQYNEYISQLQ